MQDTSGRAKDLDRLMTRKMLVLLQLLIFGAVIFAYATGTELPRRLRFVISGGGAGGGIAFFLLLLLLGYRGEKLWYPVWFLLMVVVGFMAAVLLSLLYFFIMR